MFGFLFLCLRCFLALLLRLGLAAGFCFHSLGEEKRYPLESDPSLLSHFPCFASVVSAGTSLWDFKETGVQVGWTEPGGSLLVAIDYVISLKSCDD